jgi:DNA modification methylase
MTALTINYIGMDKLIPYVNNSRTHDEAQVAQIASSIKEFGFTNPILIDDEGGIIAGHGRVMAARKLSLETVPTITLSGLSDLQKRAYIIADNKLALNAGWDNELLMLELDALKDADYDLDLTGFSTDEISDLMPEQIPEGLTDEDAVPEVQDEPISKLGDVWLLGKHRVMCGDSTSIDAVETLMAGQMADMVFTDPPYNVAVTGGTHDPRDKKNFGKGPKIMNDSMPDAEFKQFLVDAFTTMSAVIKDGAAVYVAHADSEGVNFRSAFTESGFLLKQCLIWAKQQFVFGRSDYHWQHEPILYGWKAGSAHSFYGARNQGTLWNIDRPIRSDKAHPTQKPVALVEKAIINSSKTGDLLYEPFGGGGSTLIACEMSGRYARLMELDPKYVDVIVRRWQEFVGKDATHAATGATFAEVEADSALAIAEAA